MEQEIRSLRDKVTVYDHILGETRRLEDRLWKSENRMFGLVIGVVVLLVGANLWYNYKVYNKDIQALQEEVRRRTNDARDELVKAHNADIDTKIEGLKRQRWEANEKQLNEFRQELNKKQPAGFAYTLGYVAEIWLSQRKAALAIRDALEQFYQTKAASGDQHLALEKLTAAFTLAAEDRQCIPDHVIENQVQPTLERTDVQGDTLVQLKEALKIYRAKQICP
jgi:hypothetical protein